MLHNNVLLLIPRHTGNHNMGVVHLSESVLHIGRGFRDDSEQPCCWTVSGGSVLREFSLCKAVRDKTKFGWTKLSSWHSFTSLQVGLILKVSRNPPMDNPVNTCSLALTQSYMPAQNPGHGPVHAETRTPSIIMYSLSKTFCHQYNFNNHLLHHLPLSRNVERRALF